MRSPTAFEVLDLIDRLRKLGLRGPQPKQMREALKLYIDQGRHTYRDKDGAVTLKTYREVADDMGGMMALSSVYKYIAEDRPNVAKQMRWFEE